MNAKKKAWPHSWQEAAAGVLGWPHLEQKRIPGGGGKIKSKRVPGSEVRIKIKTTTTIEARANQAAVFKSAFQF